MDMFAYTDNVGNQNLVEWNEPGLTIILNTLGITPQMVPPEGLGLTNETVIVGHDIESLITAVQANGQPFNLSGVTEVNFYAKLRPTDTTYVFFKTLTNNPADIIIESPPSAGLIDVFTRIADYSNLAVGTTMFLYVDFINNLGNPENISRWTLTIVN